MDGLEQRMYEYKCGNIAKGDDGNKVKWIPTLRKPCLTVSSKIVLSKIIIFLKGII